MRKGKKMIGVIILLILVLSITVGYSTLSSTFRINGVSKITNATWDLHFSNIKVTEGSVTATKNPTILETDSLVLSYEVNLVIPGDYYEFTVDVVNDGGIDVELESLPRISGAEGTEDFVKYTVTYGDDTDPKVKDKINSGDSQTYKVRVEFLKDIDISDLPETERSLNLTAEFDYIQQ